MSEQFPYMNPYSVDENAPNGRLFYGRQAILQQISQLIFLDEGDDAGQPIILVGPPRIGKTALLRHIQDGDLGPTVFPITINLAQLATDSLSAFYWDVAKTAVPQLAPLNLDYTPPDQAAFIGDPQTAFQEQFLQPVNDALADKHRNAKLLFLFDNLQALPQTSDEETAVPLSPGAIHNILNQDDMAACLFTWQGDEASLLQTHPDCQSARIIEIGPLSKEAAIALIRQPVNYIIVRDVALYIYQLTGGRPYALQKICHALYERQYRLQLNQITAADVNAVLTTNPALPSLTTNAEPPIFAIAPESGGRRTVRHVRRVPPWQRNAFLAAGIIAFIVLAVILLFPIFTGKSASQQLASALEDPTVTPTPLPTTTPEPVTPEIIEIEVPVTAEIVVTAVTVIAPTETPPATSTPTPTATPTSAPTALPDVLPTLITREQDQMPMVLIPAGTFIMGSAEDDFRAAPDEMPQHEVTLDEFYMDKYEVNIEQYASFLNRLGRYDKACERVDCAWPRELAGYTSYLVEQDLGDGTVQYFPLAGFSNYPINHVSWYGANMYCESVGGRLPTEAEWEYAARGDDGRVFPWGDENPDPTRAVFNSDSFDNVKPVDALPDGASPFGVLGMAGSMWEWTADWYSDTYYEESPRRNPTGPENGLNKVVRGGAWPNNNLADRIRATNRNAFSPDLISALVGFRCVLDP